MKNNLESLLRDNGLDFGWLDRTITRIAGRQLGKAAPSIRRSILLEDVQSQGWVVAYTVADSFDPEKGTFEHYLSACLSNELMGFVQQESCLGPVPGARTMRRYLSYDMDGESTARINASVYAAAIVTSEEHEAGDASTVSLCEVDSFSDEQPEARLIREEAAATVDRVLAEFRIDHPRQAEVFDMLHADMFDPDAPTPTKAEVAERLGTSEEAVKARYLRARRNLKERFRGAGLDSGSFLV